MIAPSDEQRQLTNNGQNEVKLSAQCLHEAQQRFDLVLVSPYIRAQQTWQIVKGVCGVSEVDGGTVVETTDDLVPEASPEVFHDYLDALIEKHQPKNILLVSHMPMVSYLVATLSNAKITPIFMTSAVAQIQYQTQLNKGEYLGMLTSYLTP